MWHVSSRSGVATLRTAIHLLLTYLLTYLARACVHACRSTAAQDYCQWDTFEASCGRRDELVVMRTAVYGRMTSGRCIERDYGYVGCQTDVLLHADLSCSGRRQCTLDIPYQPFGVAHPCPRDLTLFLRASFECVKGNNNCTFAVVHFFIRTRPLGRKTQLFQAMCRTAKVGLRAFHGRIEVPYFESATKLRAIESVYFLRTSRPCQLSQMDPRDVRPHVHPAETGGRSV